MLGILLAAGRGTRMKSAKPKVLFDINDEPLCWGPLTALFAHVDKLVVVIGYRGEEVKDAILRRAFEVYGEAEATQKLSFYTQEEQRGTGDAVKSALRGLGKSALHSEITLVVNGDLPLIRPETFSEALKDFKARHLTALTLSFKTLEPTGLGRIMRTPQGSLVGIREEKDATPAEKLVQEVNGGVYVFSTKTLVEAIETLKADNKQNEFYLTDLFGSQKNPGEQTQALCLKNPEDLLGVNTTYELGLLRKIAQVRLQKKVCEESGVEIEMPESVFVSARAQFKGPCYLGPGVMIRGNTTIEEGVHCEGNVLINSAHIHKGAKILWGTVVDFATVGPHCSVGPMAHLRPGTVLGEGVRIGNFVETKKAIFGAKSKASHLSYVGDAEVGEGSNLGAGFITCNYDGFQKHLTRIGKRAFIGSDSQMVAPVTVGDDAYVGSGTTVTQDIPSGALALSRSDLIIKEGYAQKLAAKRKKT